LVWGESARKGKKKLKSKRGGSLQISQQREEKRERANSAGGVKGRGKDGDPISIKGCGKLPSTLMKW